LSARLSSSVSMITGALVQSSGVLSYLSVGSELKSHALFAGVSRLGEEVVVNGVTMEGPKDINIHSDSLSGLDRGFSVLGYSSDGRPIIALGTTANRSVLLDAGVQRFYEAVISGTSAGAYQYLKNIVTVLHQ
jgi:hypothetical protein